MREEREGTYRMGKRTERQEGRKERREGRNLR